MRTTFCITFSVCIVVIIGLLLTVHPSPASAQTTSLPQSCVTITRWLTYGSRGAEVTKLQKFLIAQKLLAAGSATGFFGKATRTALQSWQRSHGIVSSGTPASTGYGATGPKTRKAIAKCSSGTTGTVQAYSQPSYYAQPSYGATYGQGSYTTTSSYAQPSYYTQASYTTCAPDPSSPQAQALPCPSGQTGSITQTRTSSCTAGATSPTWGAWTATASTCAALPPYTGDIYVAPAGSDRNNGSIDHPLATLGAARDMAVARVPTASGQVNVFFRGGSYFISDPVVFRPQDSGRAGAPIVFQNYPGETPILHGAVQFTGNQGGSWSAVTNSAVNGSVSLKKFTFTGANRDILAQKIQAIKATHNAGRFAITQLFINGARTTRARQPNADVNVDISPTWSAEYGGRYTPTINAPAAQFQAGRTALSQGSALEFVFTDLNLAPRAIITAARSKLKCNTLGPGCRNGNELQPFDGSRADDADGDARGGLESKRGGRASAAGPVDDQPRTRSQRN